MRRKLVRRLTAARAFQTMLGTAGAHYLAIGNPGRVPRRCRQDKRTAREQTAKDRGSS
jgi:hypothetical protein